MFYRHAEIFLIPENEEISVKKLLFLAICFFSFSINSLAQASETFDIATFQPPAGWKEQRKDGVVIFNTSNEQKGTYAMIMLFRSRASSGNAKSDFEDDWREFIAGQLAVKGKPEIEPAKMAEGYTIITGGAAFENDLGPAAVLMNTYSGHGKAFSAAGIFNSADYLPAIEAFASSIKLKKLGAAVKPGPANNDAAASILGTWGVTHSDQSSFSVRNAVMSYIRREYTFNADGTYRFISKAFDPFSTKLLFGKEQGTYLVNGDLLTITPKSSVLEGWSKKNGSGDQWGNRLDTQNRKLETVTYRFIKHYFSGIQTTSLILIAGKVTQRDGPFVGGTAFENAWIYSPPCPQCFIEMPK